jgi:hypothetical protein
VTSRDADRAVEGLLQQHPYLAPERITQAEQDRRHGQWLLDKIMNA